MIKATRRGCFLFRSRLSLSAETKRDSAPTVHNAVHHGSSVMNGVVIKSFTDSGYCIIRDIAQRQYYYRVKDCNEKVPSIGTRLLFTFTERKDQPEGRQHAAVDVWEETPSHRQEIVRKILHTLEDSRWQQILQNDDDALTMLGQNDHSAGKHTASARRRRHDTQLVVTRRDLEFDADDSGPLREARAQPMDETLRRLESYDPITDHPAELTIRLQRKEGKP